MARPCSGSCRSSLTFYILDLPKILDSTWATGERTLEPRIGWITYLPPELAARAKYPTDVEVEALADGAALVTLCEEPFGQSNAPDLARLHALEAALRPIQSRARRRGGHGRDGRDNGRAPTFSRTREPTCVWRRRPKPSKGGRAR